MVSVGSILSIYLSSVRNRYPGVPPVRSLSPTEIVLLLEYLGAENLSTSKLLRVLKVLTLRDFLRKKMIMVHVQVVHNCP